MINDIITLIIHIFKYLSTLNNNKHYINKKDTNMNNFDKSFEELMKLEFKNEDDALHTNKTEDGYTYMGIYQSAHPTWKGWELIIMELFNHNMNIKETSRILFNNEYLLKLVKDFYKNEFWDKMSLDNITHQQIQDEMFIFGVNTHWITSAKKAQELANVTVDGYIGAKSVEAINKLNPIEFDIDFDKLEIEHYNNIIEKNPSKEIFRKGWKNRALAV